MQTSLVASKTVLWLSQPAARSTRQRHSQRSAKRSTAFYRATLCVRARSLLWPGVSLSVHLSVTFVHSIQTAKDIVKLLCRPHIPIILVFNAGRSPKGVGYRPPPAEAQNTRDAIFFAIFDWNRRLSWKRSEIGAWLLCNVNRKSCALYRMVILCHRDIKLRPAKIIAPKWCSRRLQRCSLTLSIGTLLRVSAYRKRFAFIRTRPT